MMTPPQSISQPSTDSLVDSRSVLGARCHAFPPSFYLKSSVPVLSMRVPALLACLPLVHFSGSPSPALPAWLLRLPVERGRAYAAAMRDWAPSIIATALFALLCPGGVLQMPGRQRPVDLMNMKTSFPSMLVHAIIYFLLLMLFLVILQPHLYI
ncbi:unnamed protein product [Miscanthus lutarioriparius]|uniref:Uncharacterized protein n=1 Tax=Miscanthus lutarioriparius TaxID=422564 RepID=A0A811NJX2_9POAL|nr:unnamed protein product [Miscanthus lutarioriparius]